VECNIILEDLWKGYFEAEKDCSFDFRKAVKNEWTERQQQMDAWYKTVSKRVLLLRLQMILVFDPVHSAIFL
jgi:hypothetical protein